MRFFLLIFLILSATAQAQESKLPNGWLLYEHENESFVVKEAKSGAYFGYHCYTKGADQCTSFYTQSKWKCPAGGQSVIVVFVLGQSSVAGAYPTTTNCKALGDGVYTHFMYLTENPDSFAVELATTAGDRASITLWDDQGEAYVDWVHLKGSQVAYQWLLDSIGHKTKRGF